MCRSTKEVQCVCAVMVGGGIALCAAVILLTLSGAPLLDSDWPDYHESKIWMTFFQLDATLATWACTAGVFLGIGVAVIGGVRPFLRKGIVHGNENTANDKQHQGMDT